MLLAKTLPIDYLSIILLTVVIAFVIVGSIIGVLKMLVQLGGSIISIVCSLFLAKPVGTFIYNLGAYNWLISKSSNFLLTTNEFFLNSINDSNKESLIEQSLSKLNIPSLFNSVIVKIGSIILPTTNGVNLAEYLSKTFFMIVSIVLSGLLLYLIIRLTMFFISLFIKKLDKIKLIGKINHLLGGVVGLAFGLLCAVIIMVIVTLLLMIPQFNESISHFMYLDNENAWTFSKWLYEQNILALILKILGLG